ncbi:putative signaling protein containing CHASE2/PAS/GGDEF/EAL domains [Bradyrhizobium sp. ORS 285]|uniref:EAL domain-containing protein n=1 Tax=Bradyrhizobium sp. ORS 285 TaxID=115808 RepID=UPI0002406809|nr:EAL domain-containing protein [Bradyrhizobium sp. ORS 285]CCD88404.1 putative signaling protein containing CHASE2/PAS/GGDEF/EAL domains [Bradyrhizobium sp. ORS 285]SMX56845.1 putative signaling protein containing CHASE2/PAS/GGDEF/EAL domains [Bradyrhizobium sp. ORS 285]
MFRRFMPHILVVVALLTVGLSGCYELLGDALVDLRFRLNKHPASGEIAIVTIDPGSIEALGVWPWPRSTHARLLDQLQRAGVRDVAFDVDFSSPSDAAGDRAFQDALQHAKGAVVLPAFRQLNATQQGTAIHINRPLPQFEQLAWSALVNVEVARDGRVRSYAFGEYCEYGHDRTFVQSFGAFLAGSNAVKDSSFLIDYGIDPSSLPKVSYVDVLRGNADALAAIKGKRVIVGATAIELGDYYSVPNGRVLPGVVLQALAAESILQHRTLLKTTTVATVAALLLIVAVMLASWRRLSAARRGLLIVLIGVGIEAIALVLHDRYALVLDTSLLQIALVAYLTATALDEIDFRGLLRHVAESRFERIAMSIGDGLVCTDQHQRITVWNPGAVAIFGYGADEIIGQPFARLRAEGDGAARDLFPQEEAALPATLLPGGASVEFDGRRKDGEVFPVEASVSAWQGADGLQYGVILRDISLRKREAERIRYLAEHDTLTALINRNTLQTELAAMIETADGAADQVVLLVIGLDAFQHINDMLGHSFGDSVLRAAAERLRAEIGRMGRVARLSGDEFAVAIPCSAIGGTVAELAEHLARLFDAPLDAAGRQQRVKVSLGVAVHPEGGQTADELLSNAHLALCRAKTDVRGSHVIFESAIRQQLEQRLTLEAELALAVERREFELFYQPQVDLLSGRVIGAEALIRWRHPTRGLVPPGDFIPVVNTSPLSEAVATWVMATACRQAREWQLAGQEIRVGVNLSPSQFQSGDLAAFVSKLLTVTGLSPGLLELEVTEDILLHDEPGVLQTFNRLQALGVSLVFDDFGTGYASLSYLKKFPLDGLKIDRSFVRDVLTQTDDAAIVGSTVSLSKQLGLSVIAEGIENQATADFLLRLGCEQGQGYHFGKPMPAAEFEQRFLQVNDTRRAGAA